MLSLLKGCEKVQEDSCRFLRILSSFRLMNAGGFELGILLTFLFRQFCLTRSSSFTMTLGFGFYFTTPIPDCDVITLFFGQVLEFLNVQFTFHLSFHFISLLVWSYNVETTEKKNEWEHLFGACKTPNMSFVQIYLPLDIDNFFF
jgi:hypothetical protein